MPTITTDTPNYTGDASDEELSVSAELESNRVLQKIRDKTDAVVDRIQPKIAAVSDYARSEPTKAVLVHTGWAGHWGTDQYFDNHPFLTEAAAVYLREQGAVLVGIDSLNIDSVATGERPVHTILLGNEIPIVEHMCGLSALPDEGSRFFAVPVKVKAFGTFPVRAFAMV
jgi:kynurenine formamidase